MNVLEQLKAAHAALQANPGGYRESQIFSGQAWALVPALVECAEKLNEAQEALDTLAGDAEEAGYPARAESATLLAMNIRTALAKLNGENDVAPQS